MNKARIYAYAFVLSLICVPAFANASTYYGWSESLGYFDFSNIIVTDSNITGYAYNDNTGFLNMNGVTNDGAGILSGYAWSESVGYFDFSEVFISNGSFNGYAYNDNTGFLNMSGVSTSWTPPTEQDSEPEQDEDDSKKTSRSCSIVCRVNNLIKNGKIAEAEELKKKWPKIFKKTNASDLTQKSNTSDLTQKPNIDRDIYLGITGEDVRSLQKILNSLGYTVNPIQPGPGSIGNETSFFGRLTQSALIKFQKENNITPSVGYFGPKTRAFMKLKEYIN